MKMSYKPNQEAAKAGSKSTGIAPNGVAYKYPVPDAGNQSARISLIVDIGTQERADFEEKDKAGNIISTKPQKPVQQVIVFADLVDQVVDYGGDIGKKQYRLMINRSFKFVPEGINFNAVPPRDAEGRIIKDKMWTLHPQNRLTKLAKATGNEHILGVDEESNMDIGALLGAAFYADVEVTSKDSGKKDDSGKDIIYHNVNYKGESKLPMVKGKPVEVEELECKPMILNHNNVTKDTLILIRGKVLEMMKLAPEYKGSKLEELLGASKEESREEQPTPKHKTHEEPESESEAEEFESLGEEDDDIPF
jgi:hypothetical protein